MLKSIWRFVVRQYDKFATSDGMIGKQHLTGKWRVIYPEGGKSRKLVYGTTKDYAAIFRGKVVHARYEA
jgi:hypothetical protein